MPPDSICGASDPEPVSLSPHKFVGISAAPAPWQKRIRKLRRRRSTDPIDFPVRLRVISLEVSRVEPKLTFVFGAVKTRADEFTAFFVVPSSYRLGHCGDLGPEIGLHEIVI